MPSKGLVKTVIGRIKQIDRTRKCSHKFVGGVCRSGTVVHCGGLVLGPLQADVFKYYK